MNGQSIVGFAVATVLVLAARSSLAQCDAQQIAKLIASDAAANDNFGISVAVSDDTAVVGSIFDNNAGGVDAGSVYVYVRTGGVWAFQAKLTASDAMADDWFGFSVSISGDTVVVGAESDVGTLSSAGAAYVFVRSGTVWTQQQKLTAPDAASGDQFGYSVALSGNTAVVGSKDGDGTVTNVGSAYVYVRTGGVWTLQAELTASDGLANDQFGAAVALSGDTAVVGARSDDHAGGIDAGSAYVFLRAGIVWTQQAKLIGSDTALGDELGWSVAVSGDTAVVGARTDDHSSLTNAGSAYVFVRGHNGSSAWDNGSADQQAKLIASDAGDTEYFGQSVALSGDTVVVGANFDNHAGGDNAGSAYVFARGGTIWTQRAKLIASDAAEEDEFGISVALSGDTAVIGANQDDHSSRSNAGSAYVFDVGGGALPSITDDPDSQAVCGGASVNFSVTATGGSLTYQWRKDTVNLADGGHVSGSTTNTLTINPAGASDEGIYDCVVTNSCDDATSAGATLDVCAADFDCDGFVTGLDYDLYVQAFDNGDLSADFDGDGFLTGIDFDLYVLAFEAGC